MQNAFDETIHPFAEILQDEQVESVIRKMHAEVLRYIEVPEEDISEVIDFCMKTARRVHDVSDYDEYERTTHEQLKAKGVTDRVPLKLEERARIIFSQISPHLIDGETLDLGCGDGRVSELVAAEGRKVEMADIYENPNIKNVIQSPRIDFTPIKEGKKLPYEDNSFSNIIFSTVGHHSLDPELLLKEIHRIARPGAIVQNIESVFGIDGLKLEEPQRKELEGYLTLDREQQRGVNTYFDHFYNRVLHYNKDPEKKVPVPYNFLPPQRWIEIFKALGFRVVQEIHLGKDQPTVPEYHVHFVLEVVK